MYIEIAGLLSEFRPEKSDGSEHDHKTYFFQSKYLDQRPTFWTFPVRTFQRSRRQWNSWGIPEEFWLEFWLLSKTADNIFFYFISVLLQMAKTNGKLLTSDDEAKMRKMVADLGTVHKWTHQIFLYLIKLTFVITYILSFSIPRNVYIRHPFHHKVPPPL